MNNNFGHLCAVLLGAFLMASCGGGGGSSTANPTPVSATLSSIALSPLTVSLAPGATQQLTVTGTYSDGSTKALSSGETFVSSNTAVATVSASGLVTVAAGASNGATATIGATDTSSGVSSAAAASTVVTVAISDGVPTATSATAATSTANNNALCTALAPFYWEVGNKSGSLANGSVGTTTTGASVTATTKFSIASASKWMYGAYVAQLRGGADKLTTQDITFLHFTSGYTNLQTEGEACTGTTTVNQCLTQTNSAGASFSAIDQANVGLYYYSGGHMENHASITSSPLASTDVTQLGNVEAAMLDPNINIYFTQPLLSGGIYTDSNDYAIFLRDILSGSLYMHDLLGTNSVCTQPSTCTTAASSPIPLPWYYSIGHWVETDSYGGDGTFSSPGAYGFYPWIDSTKTYYGIISRQASVVLEQEGYASVQCGRLIRHAFMSGVEQTGTTPSN